MTFIFNASPLIILAKAGHLDAVVEMATTVIIPVPVADEINRTDDALDAARQWLERPGSCKLLRRDLPAASNFVIAWDLGPGETSVITLAKATQGATAVLDDLSARRCANAFGVHVIGTIGLLLMAKKAGIIASIRRPLDDVVAAGLFISPQHLDAVRKEAGE